MDQSKWNPGALLYTVTWLQSRGKEEAVVASSTSPKGSTVPAMRTFTQWSGLPREVVRSSSVEIYKTGLGEAVAGLA